MDIQPFGIIIAVAGAVALVVHYRWTIYFAFSFTVLGAAAAVFVTALGGATITPPHLFSVFVIVKAVLQRDGLHQILRALSLARPGGWLALVVSYGIFMAFVAPQLFPDTLVYAFGHRASVGNRVLLDYLQYGSGQTTQSLYAVGDVAFFSAAYVLLRRPGAWDFVLGGLTACTAANLLFAAVDLGTFYAGNPDFLSFVRDANYAQLYMAASDSGIKRITGSFPEASTFATYSTLLLGFWTSLWMQHFRPRFSGLMALATLIALLLSTSSTGYVAVGAVFCLFAASDLVRLIKKRAPQRLGFILASLPVLLFLALLAVIVRPDIVDTVSDTLDSMVFNKLNSTSGLERSLWNSQLWQDFLDTYLMGVGLGGGRGSGYIGVLVGNVGLIGTISFIVFVCKVLTTKHFDPVVSGERAVGIACRWAFVSGLVAASISAGVFELGVNMYLVAAAAAALGLREPAADKRKAWAVARSAPKPASAP